MPEQALNPERSVLGNAFDRTYRSLHGLPDVTEAKATTLNHVSPILEQVQSFIVQTVRHRERGDFCFITYVGAEGSVRVCLPPEVVNAIARQRDSLTTKSRKRAGRAEAARRKAAGIEPGFLKIKKKA